MFCFLSLCFTFKQHTDSYFLYLSDKEEQMYGSCKSWNMHHKYVTINPMFTFVCHVSASNEVNSATRTKFSQTELLLQSRQARPLVEDLIALLKWKCKSLSNEQTCWVKSNQHFCLEKPLYVALSKARLASSWSFQKAAAVTFVFFVQGNENRKCRSGPTAETKTLVWCLSWWASYLCKNKENKPNNWWKLGGTKTLHM